MIVVLGQPRTGTSLAMQMIHAAGFECLGEWPAFEDDRLSPHEVFDLQCIGARQAGKVLVSTRADVPRIPGHARVILTSRDARQQALSERKLMNAMFPSVAAVPNRAELRRAIDSYERTQTALARSIDHVTARCSVRFERALAMPAVAARAIAAVIGADEPAIDRMAAVVRARDPGCYPGLMEIEQLEATP